MAEQPTKKLLIISVDFGTTYCAVAYALLNPDQRRNGLRLGEFPMVHLHPIQMQSEPGNSEQVKTQLAWCERKQDFLWGGEVDQAIYEAEIQESSRLTLLKFGLDETDEKSQGIRDDLELQLDGLTPQCGKRSILELIEIYLEKLYTYSKQEIREARMEDPFREAAVQCLICVPAHWDYEAREKMVEVASRACSKLRFPQPKLVSEPEAAVMFSMLQQAFNLETAVPWPKESFLVLDVGGGTGVSTRRQSQCRSVPWLTIVLGSRYLHLARPDVARRYCWHRRDMWVGPLE